MSDKIFSSAEITAHLLSRIAEHEHLGAFLATMTKTECPEQIDSISQSWSVLSGAGESTRSRRAMDAVYARLVRHDYEPGWASLMMSILFLGGVQLITIGVIGEYIARLSANVRQRPLYIIAESDRNAQAGEPRLG